MTYIIKTLADHKKAFYLLGFCLLTLFIFPEIVKAQNGYSLSEIGAKAKETYAIITLLLLILCFILLANILVIVFLFKNKKK